MTTETSTGRVPAVERADDVAGPVQGDWTYADYAVLPDDGCRYEILDGVLYRMPPSPSDAHQAAVTRIVYFLVGHVELGGLGIVRVAPLDVELPGGATVQPDVFVVLRDRLGILQPGRTLGAPDLVVEVLSPGTAGYDRGPKRAAYARSGVREYWLVDPWARTVEVVAFAGGQAASVAVVTGPARVPSLVLPDLPVRVEQFFSQVGGQP
jgi:Uma2 family endonuclease